MKLLRTEGDPLDLSAAADSDEYELLFKFFEASYIDTEGLSILDVV